MKKTAQNGNTSIFNIRTIHRKCYKIAKSFH